MKVQWGFVFLATSIAIAQVGTGNVVPKVSILPIQPNTVALLHLAAGYTTSIRLPEEISSVVVGSPATFKAEHSEAEPWLVFLKPTTTLQSHPISNGTSPRRKYGVTRSPTHSQAIRGPGQLLIGGIE